MNNIFLVCEVAHSYGISLDKARRLSEEEKEGYSEWFKECGFIGLSDNPIYLESLNWSDVLDYFGKERKSDGCFLGCSNSVYIITQEEWDELVVLNNQKEAEKKKKKLLEDMNFYKTIISSCERQGKLYTKEESKVKRIEYNNLHNEGGEGYVPHFYTLEDYENAKNKVLEIQKQLE